MFLHSFAGGGAERVAVLLANSMVQRGGFAEIVVKNGEGPWRAELDPRVSVIVLKGRYRWLILRIMRYFRDCDPDAAISFISDINVMVLIASVLSGWKRPLVVSERSSLQEIRVKWGSLKGGLLWFLMRRLYRHADRVVAVSRQLALDIIAQLDLPSEKVVAIPNPVPAETIRKFASRQVSHRFFSAGPPVVIAVGRLHSSKDFPTLIRAIADLKIRREVRLIILGEGPDRSMLQELVGSLKLEDAVDLPGFVSPPWPWMARSRVLVLSSRVEGWPNVLAEALALGIPVVATDCPTGPSEILENGKYGRLVPVGDYRAMSLAVEETLNAPLDRHTLNERAAEWSTERALDAYLDCLRRHGNVGIGS